MQARGVNFHRVIPVPRIFAEELVSRRGEQYRSGQTGFSQSLFDPTLL